MNAKIEQLEKDIASNRTTSVSAEKDMRMYMAENKKLRKIIDTYVYPEIANELLKKEGIKKNTANIADPDRIESNLVSANSSVSEIKSNVIKGLFTVI